MGPGFKYHVVTIAAIFFALTVGLVVGSLYVSPSVTDQQKRAILRLQKMQESDIRTSREQLKQYQNFVGNVTPVLLHGRLSGVNVAIVLTGDYPEAVARVKDALQMANANLLSVTNIEQGLDRSDDKLNADLSAQHASEPRLPVDRAGVLQMLATILAEGDSPLGGMLDVLERARLVSREVGSDYLTPAQYVILVAGDRTEPSSHLVNVDRPLIEDLQKHNVVVLACEPQDSVISNIATYRAMNLNIGTVDNVDTEIGQCALVFALRDGKDDYGVKSSAAQLLPSPLTK